MCIYIYVCMYVCMYTIRFYVLIQVLFMIIKLLRCIMSINFCIYVNYVYLSPCTGAPN